MFIMVQSDVSTKARAPFMLETHTNMHLDLRPAQIRWCELQNHELSQAQTRNWPPESSQHQELSLGAPEYAVGLLLVKHLCTRKKKKSQNQWKNSMNSRLRNNWVNTPVWRRSCSPTTHSRFRSFRYFWRDKRRRWFLETLHGEQQTCCRWAPRQMLWCFLEKTERNDTSGRSSLGALPSILTFHLNHINGDLLLSHAEDLKVGNNTLKRFKNNIYNCFFFFFKPNPEFPPFFYFISVPAFLLESCPLSRTDNLRFSASAVCSQPRWRGCERGSPGGKATASESLWLGCLCPQVPRMLWCCHQATMKSLCRHKFKVKT